MKLECTILTNLLSNVCSLNDQTLEVMMKTHDMRWPEHHGNMMRRGEILSRLKYKAQSNNPKSYQGQCITNDLWVQNLRSTGI